LDPGIHGHDARLRRFVGGRFAAARKRIKARDETVLVPLDTLKVEPNQVAYRKLPMSRRIDHVLQARRFDEQMLAIRQHLVMHQWMLSPKLFAKVVHGTPNLRQLDVILPPKRIEDMRLRQIGERQLAALRVRKLDDGL